MKKITLFAFFLAVLAGCVQKEMTTPVTPSEGQKVTLTFDVNTPESKVAFDDSDSAKLEWTGNETMTLVFGKSGVGGADYNPAAKITIPSASAGVFSGVVTIPSGFTLDDLQAIVVPSECEPYFDWRDSTESRVVMPVPDNQVVDGDDALNWQYAPFFYDLSTVSKEESTDKNYTFSGLELKSASDLVRFNVYGADDSDEKLLSVSFSINDTGSSIAGSTHWTLGSTGTGINNSGGSIATVSLKTPATITSAGVKVYAAFLSKNNRVISDVVVKTDKATYFKTFDSGNVTLPKTNVTDFCVQPVGLDLSKFTRVSGEGKYSADNGTTWTNELPATFTSLSVRYDISADELKAIAAAVKAQASAVDLDMSNSIYASKTFPKLFNGASNIKSIKFPVNVITIADQAFDSCKTIKSVDLSRIVKLGYRAFYATGLTSVRLENHIKSLGKEAFRCCYYLEEAYFDVSESASYPDEKGNPDKDGSGVFRWHKNDATSTPAKLTVTVGPNANLMGYFVSDNKSLVKLVIEYNGDKDKKIYGNVFNRTYYLQTIICKGKKGMLLQPQTPNVGEKVEGTKYLVVPDGCTDLYKNHTAATSFYNKFSAQGFTLIEQSAYDALQSGSTVAANE